MSNQSHSNTTLAAAPRTSQIWNRQTFETNHWHRLADNEPVTAGGFALVSLDRWRAERSTLLDGTAAAIGVEFTPNDEVDPESDEIHRLALIVLPFPKFTDGRSYSTARRLREQWGYANELRASGDVLLDQIQLMTRCGFTSFEICDQSTIRILERSGSTRMPRMYQSPARHGDLWRRTGTTPRALVAAE